MNKISRNLYIVIVSVLVLFFTACNQGSKDSDVATEQTSTIPQKGDSVPNNLVCMVNNAYMGVPQLEVP